MWFVYGSIFSIVIPIVPLLDIQYHFFQDNKTSLSVYNDEITWLLVLIAGIFFTIGSYIWVRSFHQPPLNPLLPCCKCFKTDELLAAWFFLLGAIPPIPYVIIFLISDYTALDYWALLIAAILFLLVTSLFVHACYVFANYNVSYIYNLGAF